MSIRDKLKRSVSQGEQDFYMPEDGSRGRREQPGVRRSLRMWRNGEAYGYLDPDEISSLGEPPAHAQAALEDVLGEWAKDEDGGERIKLRVHPHMRRWCLYEREYRPEIGANLWRCFYIFQTDPQPGYLPPDMDGDLYMAHFRGRVGDYVEPDRSHLEMIERFNIKKYGVDAVNEHAGALQDKEQKAIDDREEERTQAFVDEHWNLARDEANQVFGSGQYMCDAHCRNWSYKSDLTRYRRTEKSGYVLIEKKSRDEYLAEVKEELIAFAEAWGQVRGLRRKFTPTEAEWAQIMEKSGIDKNTSVPVAQKILATQLDRDIEEMLINRAPDDTERNERREALKAVRLAAKIKNSGGT